MVAFSFNLSTVEAETGGFQQVENFHGAVFLIHPYGCVMWQCAVKGREGDRERGWACGLEYMTSSLFSPRHLPISQLYWNRICC